MWPCEELLINRMRPHATYNVADSINGLSDFPIGSGLMCLMSLIGVAILHPVTFITQREIENNREISVISRAWKLIIVDLNGALQSKFLNENWANGFYRKLIILLNNVVHN